MIISTISAVGSFAVDAFVAAMLLQYLWLPQVSATGLAIAVLLFCWALIAVGRYRLFEQVTKWCVILLSVATVAAVTMAVWTTVGGLWAEPVTGDFGSTMLEVADTTISERGSIFSLEALPFVIAFMGWMPGGLELSVWQSLWVQADGQDSGEAASMGRGKL